MFQPNLPGLEEFLNSPGEILDNPEKIIDSLERKGYEGLSDFNSGKFLSGSNEMPYIPYRIVLPSGKVLDEDEITQSYDELYDKGLSKQEVNESKLFYKAINHEDTNKDFYKFGGRSFISEEDRIQALRKYSENPFFLEEAN